MYRLFLLFISMSLYNCAPETPTAQEIIDNAIDVAGGDIISNASIHFKFREYYYRATRENGLRTFERCTDAACEAQRDVIKRNGDFVRFRESIKQNIPDSMSTKYASSVNSVHYFSVLPYGLNDKAVLKTYDGETIIHKEPYYKIKVTFKQDGGGEDFQDEYMYWIHKKTYTVDYLAYNYKVNEGGTRFRAAYNERVINGVRIVDYKNYKPEEQFPPLTELGSLYENEKLELLSKIELEDVTIAVCPNC